jgi:hypothetical protein
MRMWRTTSAPFQKEMPDMVLACLRYLTEERRILANAGILGLDKHRTRIP